MRTRSTSSIEGRWRAPVVTLSLLFAVFAGCDDDPTPVVAGECRPNQFRLCDAECGRGVEQCVDPGRWNGCLCTVLDAGYVFDARPDRDANDAADAGDASEGSAADSPAESGEASDPAEGGDSASDAEPG